MKWSGPIYVIDTNVIVDYPGIIPDANGEMRMPQNPSVDLRGTHRVLPTAVIRELSGFKAERSIRGRAAREALKNTRALFGAHICGMKSAYAMGMTVDLPDGGKLTILPVHADFKKALPFRPAEDDMDGQIILASLAVMHLEMYSRQVPAWTSLTEIDWSNRSSALNATSENIALVTNDNGLATRAMARGVQTLRYTCDLPQPYTGRREVEVPEEIFAEFYEKRRIDRDLWEGFMPEEEPLVANEFIVMQNDPNSDYKVGDAYLFYRNIGRYDAREDAIVGLSYASQAPFRVRSAGQAMYAEALLNPNIAAVICTGPAGSGKTYLPTVYGVDACRRGAYTDVVIVPCADLGNLGSLPGDLDEKMILDVGPLRNALRNYLLNEDAKWKREFERIQRQGISLNADEDGEETSFNDRLQRGIERLWKQFFRNIPVEKARGLDFLKELAVFDEFQDQSPAQADMLVKRIGQDGKIVMTGDIKQIHAPYLDESNNGITYVTALLHDSPLVARVSLLKDEVERHELVRMIAERQAKDPEMVADWQIGKPAITGVADTAVPDVDD